MPTYKPVGVDENSLFPPRVQSQLSATIAEAVADKQSAAELDADTAALVADGDSALAIAVQNLAGGYRPETISLFERMAVRPDADRRHAIDTLISALIIAEVWGKLDCLYVFAAHHEQAARQNWVSPLAPATAVNSPAFTIDRGFQSDGATSYLTAPVSQITAPKYLPSQATLGAWVRSAVNSDSQQEVALPEAYINARGTGGGLGVRANFGGAVGSVITFSVNSSAGLSAWSRNATTVSGYKNGSLIGSVERGYETLSQPNMLMLRGMSPTQYSTREVSLIVRGATLTEGDMAAFYTAALTYMQAVGAE